MIDPLILVLFLFFLLAAIAGVFVWQRSVYRKKLDSALHSHDAHARKFRENFFKAQSAVLTGDDIDKSLNAVVIAAAATMDADAFILKRDERTADLTAYSTKRGDELASMLSRAGMKFDPHRIPLSNERAQLFESEYRAYDDLFTLIEDLVTSAASRKIQRELKIDSVISAPAKSESGQHLILLLLPAAVTGSREELEQFAELTSTAFTITGLKKKVKEFEEKFDEQFVAARNELRARESAHLSVFSEMTLPAALIDQRGVVIESNDALGRLFPQGMNPIGQPLSSVMEEEFRREFISLLMNLPTDASSELGVKIGGKSFKVHIVPSKFEGDGRLNIAVYFFDETPLLSLKEELGRTIDSLRAEKETAEKAAAEERAHIEELVAKSPVPVIEVVGGNIVQSSDSLRNIFVVSQSESLPEFISRNGFTGFDPESDKSESVDSQARTFLVEKWAAGTGTFYSFSQTTALNSAKAETERLTSESENLFDGPLPTAYIKDNQFVRSNSAFESVFSDVISSERTLEGLLKYLGESPGTFLAELQSGGIASRSCRTKDRKSFNISASTKGDLILLYAEDVTDEEDVRQELRRSQNLLSDALESFSTEPFFIVENGIVSAANASARDKLGIKLDQPFEGGALLSNFGFSVSDGILELEGVVHKVNVLPTGSSIVYRFEEVTRDLKQKSEIDRLAKRQDILKELSSSTQFEGILENLKKILSIDEIESVKLVCTGTVLDSKESAEVFVLSVPMNKIEPSLTLSLTPEDIAAVDKGGASASEDLAGSTFMNVVSGGSSRLVISDSPAGDARGFASIAFQEGEVSEETLDELTKVLKVASSVAIGIHTRASAERKFESSDKVTRALVGLTGIGDEGFDDAARKSADLLRQVFTSDSVGIYAADGPVLHAVAMNGALPGQASLPDLKFGSLVPAAQLEKGESTGAEGLYYAVKSRKKDLIMIFKFVGIPPAPSELGAIGSIALDLLESRRGSEHQSRVADQLLGESQQYNEFLTSLAAASGLQDVLTALRVVLEEKFGAGEVNVGTQDTPDNSMKPLELQERPDADKTLFRINLVNFGFGVVTVKCPGNEFARSVVKVAVGELEGLLASKIPALQRENEVMRSELDKAKNDLAALRDSVDKVPSSMRNARIKIDNALSRLPFVQGEDSMLQEIKLQLAAAAKDISNDVDSSTKNQDDIFDAVRATLMERPGSRAKFKSIEISVLADFRAPGTSFDLIKDLLVNFLVVADIRDGEVLLMTAQPSPSEAASGKGKHVSVRLVAPEGDMVHDEPIRNNVSVQTMIANVEKMGYEVDSRALGNELTLDICEVKSVETTSTQQSLSALLVEDDQVLAHEESQKLIEVFSLLKVASDAVEAAMIMDSAKFDIAFVDLSLPSINGRELCQQIKKEQPACTTILLTNREGEERSDGVDRILQRPLDTRVLRSLTRK